MNNLDTSNVHLLLVEDNEGYLERALRRIKKFGYQHIDTALDEIEAREKLEHKHYDVIVSDMRLGQHDAGGFTIVDEVIQRNITSVIIILTANDTVQDCRKALKGYACWDYISKSGEYSDKKSPLEKLHESIQEALIYLNRWGNRKDEKWIEENWAYLLEKHLNKYIAVINNAVIEFADTEEVLKQRLGERKLPLFLPVIRKIKTESTEPPLITDLLQQEESETLEFKATLQCDMSDGNKADTLRFEVLGAIVGFMNHEGGTLLIGVRDDNVVLGLEPDLSTLGKRKDLDGFQQQLNNLICDRIGAEFAPLTKIRFANIEGKDICAIDVKRATEPVFLNAQDGKRREKQFHVRQGNSTRLLNVEQSHHYIRLNWK